jgi:hypothetical protein
VSFTEGGMLYSYVFIAFLPTEEPGEGIAQDFALPQLSIQHP